MFRLDSLRLVIQQDPRARSIARGDSRKRQAVDVAVARHWLERIIGYIAYQESKGQPVYQRDLETRFGVTRSTASKVVSLMAQKGLVEQQSVPEDKRLRRLVLTPKAEEVKRLMDADHSSFEETLRRGFSESELQTLFSLLERLKENLTQMDEKEE